MATRKTLELDKAAELLLEECRMVLPGIQALFGFQMIAVFNPRFAHDLSSGDRCVHFAAIILICVAIGLIMTPAAYHRLGDPREVTDDFIRVCTRLMLWSMAPLALGIGLDVYVIAKLIFGGWIAPLLSGLLVPYFVALWFVFPLRARATDARSSAE